jgi:Domain of unknown function (DUF4157)
MSYAPLFREETSPVGKPMTSPRRPSEPVNQAAAPSIADQAVRPPDATPAIVPPLVHAVLNSPGQSLTPELRGFMEPRFGHNFGQVRVHLDKTAADSARDVNAAAYSVGKDVVFAAGEFQPWTDRGMKLLAHELAHTVQQENVDPKSGNLRVGLPADSEEQAAEQMAAHGLSGDPVSAAGVTKAPTLRRQSASTSPAGSSSPTASGEARFIASFDVDPGTKRPWNLNQLTKEIVSALTASELAYVRILGVYPTKANEDDPPGNAYQRADTVRRALIQWIGPGKFSEDRFDVAFASGQIGDPQIQVMIAYKPRVLSDPKTPLPAQPAPKPAPAPTVTPTTSAPPSLIPSQTYPGQATNAFSAFLETPIGKKFKDAALVELNRVWTKTSLGEKIVILVHLLTTLGVATYGLAKMSPSEQKGILDLIVRDQDVSGQIPLPAKQFPLLPLTIPF